MRGKQLEEFTFSEEIKQLQALAARRVSSELYWGGLCYEIDVRLDGLFEQYSNIINDDAMFSTFGPWGGDGNAR